jgi:hypothetical protein
VRSKQALEAALCLAAQGIACFPCRDITKVPTCPHGFKDATTDLGTLKYLWARYPGALVGVPTGEKFTVVDFDFAKHAESKVYHDKLDIPRTRIHRTRSGGLHYLFQPHPEVRCTASYIHKGVDSRKHGGYIIWWPAAGLDVLNADELAPVPATIIAALRRLEQKIAAPAQLEVTGPVERRLSGILEATARAQEGTRNAITFWSACRIADMRIAGEISDDDADAAYAALATVSMHIGLPQREIDKTIDSARRRQL